MTPNTDRMIVLSCAMLAACAITARSAEGAVQERALATASRPETRTWREQARQVGEAAEWLRAGVDIVSGYGKHEGKISHPARGKQGEMLRPGKNYSSSVRGTPTTTRKPPRLFRPYRIRGGARAALGEARLSARIGTAASRSASVSRLAPSGTGVRGAPYNVSRSSGTVARVSRSASVSRLRGVGKWCRAGVLAGVAISAFDEARLVSQWRSRDITQRDFVTGSSQLAAGQVGAWVGVGIGSFGGPVAWITVPLGYMIGDWAGRTAAYLVASTCYDWLDRTEKKRRVALVYAHYAAD